MTLNRYLRQAMILGWLCLLLASVSGQLVSAQAEDQSIPERLEPALHFSHLTSDDGLIQNTVESILQDNRGFMWFGTPAGLSKYDGYQFTTYRHDPDNPNSLSANWIRDLYEDRDGMIWIATEGGGMNKYDPRTDTFTRYLPERGNPNTLLGDRVFHIFQERSGNFWFVGGGLTGLNRYDPRTEMFTHYPIESDKPDAFHGGGVWDMHEADDGSLWLAASHVLAKYDPRTDNFTYFEPPAKDSRAESRLAVLHEDARGNLWTAGREGLYQFDIEQETFTHSTFRGSVFDLLEDENGLFWIASGNGLFVFDPQSGDMLHHYQHDSAKVDSLSTTALSELYQDREGVLWIGTNEGGINTYDPRQASFAHYRHDPDNAMSLAEGSVNAIHVIDDQRLWVAIGSTLDRVDLATGQVKHYTPDTEQGPPGSINAMHQDRTGIVWVGTIGSRLYQFDPETEQFSRFAFESVLTRPTPPKAIKGFYEDGEGALWIAVNHDGLYRLDAARENFRFYESPPPARAPNAPQSGGPPPAIRPPINDLYGDSAGHIWTATYNGFYRFDPRTETYEAYRATSNPSGPDSYMETLIEARDGLIWVASRDGLIRFDSASKTSRYYTDKDGLPSNFVVGILEDDDGNLWLGTKRGLSKFSPADETFRNFDVADGLQGNEFADGAFARTADGRMFFGGMNGLTTFYPDQITSNTYQPPVVLTDFQLFNRTVQPGADSPLLKPITETDSVTLNYEQNILAFEFSALSYAAPSKNRYRHRLVGFDNDWTETDSRRRFVMYTNLPAGDYVFRVQGTNNDGVWSDQEVALNLMVLPPWWETTVFRVVAMLAVIGLVLGGYQWRVQAIRRRNRDLVREVKRQTSALQQRTLELQTSEEHLRHAKEAAEAANRAKSAFLANMSHELRSPLNVMLGFAQVINRNTDLPQAIHKNLDIILHSGEHLLTLINQVLDLSKIEAGHMTLDKTDFDFYRLLDDMDDMFILKAEEKGLPLIFDRPVDLPRYLHTDAVKLRQILINLIGNALKFTESGGVMVRVRSVKDHHNAQSSIARIRFEIEDTGPGIPPDEMASLFKAFAQTSSSQPNQEGTGLGLTISRRFVHLLGGEITVDSQVGHGSMFAFEIQCQIAESVSNLDVTNPRRIVGVEPGQPRYRVLIVDDKWVNRQLLVELLGPLGFELREAGNGQEAVAIAQDFQPHLIWMDLRMPVMDGFEATKRIKATPQGQAMAIIALTASAFEEQRADITSIGCDDFLRKPFRPEEIFGMLSKHTGVRYIDVPVERTDPDTIRPETLKSALNSLPADLLALLTEGVELGDMGMIDRAVREIESYDHELAGSLARLTDRFEYDVLLNLVKEPID